MPRFKVVVAMEYVGEIVADDAGLAEFYADQWDADTASGFELLSGPTVMEVEEVKE